MKKNKTTNIVAGILMVVFIGLFLVLTGRFLYIQAAGEIDNVSLHEWAKQKRTSSYTLEAERGRIFDSNGMTLAYDRPVFRIYAITDKSYSENPDKPRHVNDPGETAKLLAPILGVDASEIASKLEYGINEKKFQVEFGKAGRELSLQKKDEIEKLKLPGINFIKESKRFYPNGMFASHIIGFARDTEEDKDGETIREIKGITGIENVMNKLLSGKDGHISYQRDNYNKKLLDPNEVIQKPEDGNDVYLTIDQKIQTLLEDVMGQVEERYEPERMTAVVMDAKTGEIVAMSNRPSYNPNNPADVKNWYNDAISTPFEPGSTVKMFTWAAAIEEGVYNGSETYKSGMYKANERLQAIGDHNGGKGWGPISFDEGFQRSSNVAAAKLVWEKLGTETFLEYLKAFDFDKKTGIDLPGEITGQILYNWPLEKITTAFGQGSTITPIQQMKAATAIANGGKMLQPYVIKKITDPNTGKVIEENSPKIVGEPISKKTAAQVMDLLESVVNSKNGTGKMYALDNYTVVGKTGTAEIPNPKGPGYITGHNNYVFSFLGMAPKDDPRLIMYVSVKQPNLLTEDGYEPGSAPVSFIFKNVMENSLHYMDIEPDKEENNQTKIVKTPDVIGEDVDKVKDSLTEMGLNVTVIGSGKKILDTNAEKGTELLPNSRVILLTEKAVMPKIIGWSQRDVLQLTDLLELKVEIIGNGYVISQNIKEGKPIKKNDYLGVELQPPNEQKNKSDTSEPVTDTPGEDADTAE